MNQEQILAELQQIFCEVLKRDNIIINETSTSNDVEGWDSLTHMIIISKIEKHFGIMFNFRELMKLKNVGDLRDVIQTKMK